MGATGAVGKEMLATLEARNFPVDRLTPLASKRSAGKEVTYKGAPVKVQELTHDAFKDMDIVLSSAGGSISKEFAPSAVKAGAVVIDNTSAFRYEKEVPLVVPEINPQDVKTHQGIIANPNCTTIISLMAMAPLHRAFGIKRAIMSSYQAISGAGAQAMAELEQQTRDWVAGNPLKVEKQPKQIAFNVIPRIDAVQDNLYTKEEMKFLWESRKILHCDTMLCVATCVRVPVMRSHAVSLNLEFEQPVTREQAIEALEKAKGVEVQDDVNADIYPTPLDRSEIDNVAVGRIRQDISIEDNRGLCLWVVGDQLSKGAALNAVQIAELLDE
jgi:aspartate-semialdehyde dehydrogenase